MVVGQASESAQDSNNGVYFLTVYTAHSMTSQTTQPTFQYLACVVTRGASPGTTTLTADTPCCKTTYRLCTSE